MRIECELVKNKPYDLLPYSVKYEVSTMYLLPSLKIIPQNYTSVDYETKNNFGG